MRDYHDVHDMMIEHEIVQDIELDEIDELHHMLMHDDDEVVDDEIPQIEFMNLQTDTLVIDEIDVMPHLTEFDEDDEIDDVQDEIGLIEITIMQQYLDEHDEDDDFDTVNDEIEVIDEIRNIYLEEENMMQDSMVIDEMVEIQLYENDEIDEHEEFNEIDDVVMQEIDDADIIDDVQCIEIDETEHVDDIHYSEQVEMLVILDELMHVEVVQELDDEHIDYDYLQQI